MGKINLARVILGGLVAGLVVNVGETILNMVVIADDMAAALAARNLPPVEGAAITSFVVMTFGLGIAMVWLYAAIRPRFGPGAPTAVVAGVVAWFLTFLWPGVADLVLQVYPTRVASIAITWGLVESVVGTIAGAAVYRE